MDWFAWTGMLFREAGARPALPLMTAASFYLFLTNGRALFRSLPKELWKALLVFALVGLCGLGGFVLNLIFSWSYFGGSKDPVFQAVAQMALFLLTPVILVAHTSLLKKAEAREAFLSYIPFAASFHIVCMLLDATGFLRATQFPLSVFRLTDPSNISLNVYRIAGLFTEPSYFGAMAAMYGLPLLLLHPASRKSKYFNFLVAIALFISAFYIGAKTVIPVSICGYVAFLWQTRTSAFTLTRTLALVPLISASIFVVTSTSALSIQDNLSSAMRFGSTVTALNVARAGYGITGLGFGQFHFMFRSEYVPDYMYLSQEAQDQMLPDAAHRASTFNLFARYLVETGVIGLTLWLYLIRRLALLARRYQDRSLTLGALLMGSALGFLLLQDPYCFPPLILGMAFVIAGHYDLRTHGYPSR
jgi:hypothetical protein